MSETQNTPRDDDNRSTVLMPEATTWPVLTAFGVTLMAATLVTNPWVGVAGFVIMMTGAVGWWRDVLPVDRHAEMPLRPESEWPATIVPRPGAVQHLTVGQGGHRVRIPERVHPYRAGIKGGLLGGAVMAAFAAAHGILDEGSFWYPVNLLAAVAMPSLGDATLEQLKEPNTAALTVCIVVHGLLSAVVGLLYGIILPMLPGRHFLWGGVLIPLLWTSLVGATLALVNPVLNEYVDWPWFLVGQLLFGVVTGLVVVRSEPVETLQTWPLAARVGIEAGRRAPDDGEATS